VQYTMIVHARDAWFDRRENKTPTPLLKNVTKRSDWSSEFITINGCVDVAQMRAPDSFAPLVSLKWDIPVKIIVAKNAAKTNRIAVGIQWLF